MTLSIANPIEIINPLHHWCLVPLHTPATMKQHQTNRILVLGVVSRKVEEHVISILKVIGIFWLEAVVVVVVAWQQWWWMIRRQPVVVVTIQSTRLDKSDDLPYHMLYGCIGSRVDIRKSHGWDSVGRVVCFVAHEWILQALLHSCELPRRICQP